jgi:DNA-binding winged helix-turn-helix (wHTH) protein
MAPGSTLHFGPFALDGTDDGLWCGPERCTLTAKAEAVLRLLVAHPGRLVRKADLLATVWSDAHVSDWVLTTCIQEIRHVLGDVARAPRYIATVHRQGYRFIAPVTVVATPPPLSVSVVLPQSPHATPSAGEAPESAPTAAALEEEHKLVTILCGAAGHTLRDPRHGRAAHSRVRVCRAGAHAAARRRRRTGLSSLEPLCRTGTRASAAA